MTQDQTWLSHSVKLRQRERREALSLTSPPFAPIECSLCQRIAQCIRKDVHCWCYRAVGQLSITGSWPLSPHLSPPLSRGPTVTMWPRGTGDRGTRSPMNFEEGREEGRKQNSGVCRFTPEIRLPATHFSPGNMTHLSLCDMQWHHVKRMINLPVISNHLRASYSDKSHSGDQTEAKNAFICNQYYF